MDVKRFCTFNLDGLWCGIAVERVQEVIGSQTMTPVPLAPSNVAGLVNLRGQIVTVLDLRPALGVCVKPNAAPPLLVVRGEPAVVALLLDEIGQVVEAPTAALEASPGNLPAVARKLVPEVCKFSGRLLHVLDLDPLLGGLSRSRLGIS